MVVAQLVRVEFSGSNAATERDDQGAYFGTGQHFVKARLFNVEDFAFQRQDRLGTTISALLGRTAGGVALDQEQLRTARILLLAVGELAGKARQIQSTFAPGHFAGPPRGFPGTRGVDDLADDMLGFSGVFQQIVPERARHFLFHGNLYF